MRDELFTPDWKEIAGSALWKEQILPWLKQDFQATLEERAGVGKGYGPQCIGEPPLQRETDWWAGYLTALKTVIDTPELQAFARNEKEEQDKIDEAIRKNRDRRQRARSQGF